MGRFLAPLIPTAASVVLIVATIRISAKKYYWNDEIFSYVLIADPSFSSMLTAFHDAINNTPALYFILGWLWAQLFGAGELSLRLFSCLGMVAALWITWALLRRVYGAWPAGLAITMVFCTSVVILEQMAEARMYGLFLALAAAAVYLFDRAIRTERTSPLLIAATIATHAALIHTHLFGPFYSATFAFGALILVGRPVHRGARDHLLAIVGSWPLFLLYLPSYLNQSAAYGSRGWLPTPTFTDTVEFVLLRENGLLGRSAVVLLVLGAGLHLLLRSRFWQSQDHGPEIPPARPIEPDATREHRHLLWLAFLLLALPVGIFLFSVVVRPIFWDRYMIPSVLGWAILIAGITSRLAFGETPGADPRDRVQSYGARAICLAMLVPMLVFPLDLARATPPEIRPGSTDDRYGFGDLPVVVQLGGDFLERHHYAPDRDRYYYVLDPEGAADPRSGGFGPQEVTHMEAYLRQYPDRFGEHILTGDTFLERHERFLVLDYIVYEATCPPRTRGLRHAREWIDVHCPQWVERRLIASPDYDVRVLGEVEGRWVVLLVERDFGTNGEQERSEPLVP